MNSECEVVENDNNERRTVRKFTENLASPNIRRRKMANSKTP